MLKLDDLYKFKIANLMPQLVNNKLPRNFLYFLLLQKWYTREKRDWHQRNIWFVQCTFQDLELNDYNTITKVKYQGVKT